MSSKIYSFITSLFNANQNLNCENNIAVTAIDYINKNYSKRLTVDDIARYINLSPSQFSRQFKKQIGTSPYDYLLSVRLTKAKEQVFLLALLWCRRRDLNPHEFAFTRT